MTVNLVKRLRTCSGEERRAVARELGKTGNNKAVQELIRMAEGRRRYWLRCYNLDEQLIGVEVMGETRSQKALDYLHRLGETGEERDPVCHGLLGWNSTTKVYEIHPYARKALSDKLKRLMYVEEFTHKQLSPTLQDITETKRVEEQPSEAHKVIYQSIQKLEATVENAPYNP